METDPDLDKIECDVWASRYRERPKSDRTELCSICRRRAVEGGYYFNVLDEAIPDMAACERHELPSVYFADSRTPIWHSIVLEA